MSSPNQDEPPPVQNASRPIWELVVEDMEERNRIGTAKYGTPLQAHNGRDAIVDFYQELLDAVVYVRQFMEEGRPKPCLSDDCLLLGIEHGHTLLDGKPYCAACHQPLLLSDSDELLRKESDSAGTDTKN